MLGLMIGRVDRVRWRTRADLAAVLLEAKRLVEEGHDPFAEIASRVGLSEFALRRAFRATFDSTPAQIGFEARMRRAELALMAGRSSQEAAMEAGFESPSAFCRAFRRRHNLTPAAFKRARSAHLAGSARG